MKRRLIHTLLVMGLLPIVACSPGSAAGPTIVVLGFDDGSADQYQVRHLLEAHGLRGTFYVNSGLLGTSSYYMTWDQVREIAAAGNEIGGHTLTHKDLTTLSAEEQRREICDDRTALINNGFDPTSFAYPYGKHDASAVNIVEECGYSTGRVAGGLASKYSCPLVCSDYPYAESIPPADRFEIRAANLGSEEVTLAALKNAIRNAEGSGGILHLFFHNVCEDPCPNGYGWVEPSTLVSFFTWLQARSNRGTLVKTSTEAGLAHT